MTPLNDYQRQLLFDYSLGLTSDSQAGEAEQLITSSDEASELHSLFQSTLAPLESVAIEPCPEDLTERLFFRVKEASRETAGQTQLQRLLAAEQWHSRTARIPLWRNWGEALAAAAIIMFFMGILFPTTGYMRSQYYQTRCGTQLGSIYGGLQNYVSEHDGLLPAVAMSPGAPWWKVGYQGEEDYSNTRRAWLLVKQGYVKPEEFLCPGRREDRRVTFDGIQIQNFNDFPSRVYIHLSIRIACPTSDDRGLTQKRVLIADRNPLAERFPADHSASISIELCDELIKANSRNHKYRGQNVLLYDGSVAFIKTRHTSISDDDIYTLRGMSCGMEVRGCEVPASDSDIFLAP